MTNRSFVAPLLLALSAGCGGSSTSSGTPPPAAPALGAQIDRVGRPGVSMLLLAPFTADAVLRGSTRDAYNAATDPAAWVASFKSTIAGSLAVWDGIDAACGNQLLAASGAPSATTYQALASLLADDRLILRTDQIACGYLGVELAALGAGTAATCGGRRPDEDAVDQTYSLLMIGAMTGVGDGVAAPSSPPSTSSFPFLSTPY
jgi:hypothetical protein